MSSCATAELSASRPITPDGDLEVRADLVVGADGRHTIVRERAGLATMASGAPIDVLWFRLPRTAGRHSPQPAATSCPEASSS